MPINLNSISNCMKNLSLFVIFFSLLININFIQNSNGLNLKTTNTNDSQVIVKNHSSYVDLNKNIVVVGSVVVSKNVTSPKEVIVGLNVYNNILKKNELLTVYPYNKILYGGGDEPIPFKFIINSNKYSLPEDSIPIIYQVKNIDYPFIKDNTFNLKYSPVLNSSLKELHGTVTNKGLTPITNLILYAIVHDSHGNQIDSVKTSLSKIDPRQTVNFTLIPNLAIKDKVSFYSCVGGNLETMKMDSKKFVNLTSDTVLGYKFSDLMELNSIDYSANTSQFKMDIKNVYPLSAALNIEIMPRQKNITTISMDGLPYDSPKVSNTDNSTLVDLFIPQGSHQISISGFNK